MGALELTIDAPGNGIPAVNPVHFVGHVVNPPPGPLFVKWYSSRHQPPNTDDAPIHQASLGSNPVSEFDFNLPLGEQIITFTAKDVEEDDEPSLLAAQYGGLAGGEPSATNTKGLRIHVVDVGLLVPAVGATLSRAGATLVAIAPPDWNSPHRAIRLVFRFTPLGLPARPSADFPPPSVEPVFLASNPSFGNLPTLTYSGPLSGLGGGDYLLHTRFESTEPPHTGHERTTQVFLTA